MNNEQIMIDLINSRLKDADYEQLHLILIFTDSFLRKSWQKKQTEPQ